ncbi:MAG: hypothetical protein II894_02790 [Bacteroidales bacterium]|nr:hypothetical protein [Bacteroidales bacterium]MBR1991383.1 hypothetical protein [Bacteroidales bacterium]MDD6581824.1 hypothetical protein [Bacteroidales bacterium]
MQKKVFPFLFIALLAIMVSSCAPRIYGARPHRRDRNCGCEVPAHIQKSENIHPSYVCEASL